MSAPTRYWYLIESISSVTPLRSIAVSSSFTTSSNVKPYWNPEQPPPCTNTRSFNAALPSSSISCFTFAAAASEKISGPGVSTGAWVWVGVSTGAFIWMLPKAFRHGELWGHPGHSPNPLISNLFRKDYIRPRGGGGQLQRRHPALGRNMDHQALDHRAVMHLQRAVLNVTLHARLGLQFDQLCRVNRTLDPAGHHDVAGANLSLDGAVLADDEDSALLAFAAPDRPTHDAVDAQATGKAQIAGHRSAGTDQAADFLRDCLLTKHTCLRLRQRPMSPRADVQRLKLCWVCVSPAASTRTRTDWATAPVGNVQVPSSRW